MSPGASAFTDSSPSIDRQPELRETELVASRRLRGAMAEVGIFLLFVIVAVYSTWPLGRDAAAKAAMNLGDPLLSAWIFGWDAHALRTDPLHLFQANIFHPERFTLAYAENLLGQSVVVAPIFWVTNNALLTMNVATLLAFALGGFGVYLLVRDLTSQRGAALVAGIAYGLAPYRIASIGHIHVVGVYLIAPLLLLLLRLRRGRSWWIILGIALTLGLQFWASLTGGAMTLLAVGVWGAWELARARRHALRTLGPAVAGVALGLVLSLPVFVPYLAIRQIHSGYGHSIEEAIPFSATPTSYLTPARSGPLIAEPYRRMEERFRDAHGGWEKTLFPGLWLSMAFLVAIAAALIALARGRRREAGIPAWGELVGLFTAVALAGFVMSLGPRSGAVPEGAKLPAGLVFDLIPGNLIRVPARFAILVLLGMAIVSGIALANAPRSWRRWLVGVSLLFLVIERAPPAISMVQPPPITAAHRAVSQTTGAVLALPTVELDQQGVPLPASIPREAQHAYLSTANFRPLINGYAAFHPPSYWELVRAVQDLSSPTALAALKARGVTTLVVQTELIKGTRWQGVVDELERWPGVRRIARDKGVAVFDISAARTAEDER